MALEVNSWWSAPFSRRSFLRRAGITSVAAAGLSVGGWGPAVRAMAAANPETETLHASDWNRILAAAKKEGTITVHGEAGSAATIMPAAFEKAYGIHMNWEVTPSAELAPKVQAERAAGQYTIDASIEGSQTVFDVLYPDGWVDPIKPILILPEDTKGSNWKPGHPWYRDPKGDTVMQLLNTVTPTIQVNTDKVPLGELKSANDLLNPKWKGKICAVTPAENGAGLPAGAVIYTDKGAAFAKKLYQGQGVVVSRDYSQVAQYLAKGDYPIGIGIPTSALVPYEQAGVHVGYPTISDLRAGENVGNGFLLLWNRAPHPNAAIVFVNWAASKAGLALYAKTEVSAPVRTDIKPTWLPLKSMVPQPGQKYVDQSSPQYVKKQLDPIRMFYAGFLR